MPNEGVLEEIVGGEVIWRVPRKSVKRAFAGLSWRNIERSSSEATELLVKNGLVPDIQEAERFLDSLLDRVIGYSLLGQFVLSKTEKGYKMEIYPVAEFFSGF